MVLSFCVALDVFEARVFAAVFAPAMLLSSALTTDAVQERLKPPAPPWPPLSPRSCHGAVEAFSVNPALLPDTIEYRKRTRLLRSCMRGLWASYTSKFSVSPFCA